MDEYIRPPDKPIRECLLPTTNATEMDEFGFLESSYETPYGSRWQDHKQEEQDPDESDIELQFVLAESKRLEEEREERTKHFAAFRGKIKQFQQIDKHHADFYTELLQYIDMYETRGVANVVVTEDFYATFRKIVDNMRLSSGEKERLIELIKM